MWLRATGRNGAVRPTFYRFRNNVQRFVWLQRRNVLQQCARDRPQAGLPPSRGEIKKDSEVQVLDDH
jgi:hypothetical protein